MKIANPFLLLLAALSQAAYGGEFETEALAATSDWLKSKNYTPEDFERTPKCSAEKCTIDIVHSGSASSKQPRGCAGELCVTLTYSLESKNITKVVHWR